TIKVLHVVTTMDKGGLETRLMDIIRNINKEAITIDIYTNRLTEGYYDSEIDFLGSKLFYSKPIRFYNIVNKINEFTNFLKKHPEFQIVHIQMNSLSTIYCIGAYKANVPIKIVHYRDSNYRNSIIKILKKIIKLPIK